MEVFSLNLSNTLTKLNHTHTALTEEICILALCHCSLASIESSWSSPGAGALVLDAGSLVDTGDSRFINVAVATSPIRASSVLELVDWLVSTEDFCISVEQDNGEIWKKMFREVPHGTLTILRSCSSGIVPRIWLIELSRCKTRPPTNQMRGKTPLRRRNATHRVASH